MSHEVAAWRTSEIQSRFWADCWENDVRNGCTSADGSRRIVFAPCARRRHQGGSRVGHRRWCMAIVDNPVFNPYGVSSGATLTADSYTILRLLSLDEVWSAYLRSATNRDNPDFEGLTNLAKMMESGIDEAVKAVDRFRRVLRGQTEAFVDSALSEAESVVDKQDVGEWPFASGFDQVPMREWLISACDFVENESGSEHVILSDKIQQLESRTLPGPDFTFRWKCVLSFVGIAAGAVGGVLLVPLTAGAVLVAAGPGVALANSSLCAGPDVRRSVAGP